MKKPLLLAILAIGCATTSFAQTDQPLDSKKEKMFEHYVGVQMNSLIKQVFNFSSSTTSVNNNPYLITYNINSIKSGWGLRLGAGYNYNAKTVIDNSGTSTTSDINDLQVRLGVEKAFKLSEKWSTGVGIDLAYNSNDDKTTAITHSFDTTTTLTHSVSSSYGGGAMAWLRYNITNRILVGTETSFYYMKGKNTRTTSVQSSQGGNTSTSDDNKDDKPASATFSLPVVLYLIVKF